MTKSQKKKAIELFTLTSRLGEIVSDDTLDSVMAIEDEAFDLIEVPEDLRLDVSDDIIKASLKSKKALSDEITKVRRYVRSVQAELGL